MVWAPSGLVIPFVPLRGTRGFGTLGANFTTKHSFVCLSPLHGVMSSLVDLKARRKKRGFRGLGVGGWSVV